MAEQHLSQDQIAHFRQALLDMRAQIEADRRPNVQDERDDSEEGEGTLELADYDPNDPADEATDLYDREREFAGTDNENRILGKIDRALAKIDEGTYGLSDVDGTPIPLARLEALPYALATVEQEDAL